jgi:hypothetical protein
VGEMNVVRGVANVARQTAKAARQSTISMLKNELPEAANLYNAAKTVSKRARKSKRKAKKLMSQPTVRLDSLPTSIATTIVQPEPDMRIVNKGGKQFASLSLTQQIGPLAFNGADYGGVDFYDDTQTYRIWTFDLAPLSSYLQALAQKAVGFQNWTLKGLRADYANTLPTATTRGNAGIACVTDVTKPLPSSWQLFTSVKGAMTTQIGRPISFDFSPYVKEKLGTVYRIDYYPDRNGRGEFEDVDAASATQIAPFVFMFGTEGVNGDFGPDSALGTIILTIDVELFTANVPDPSIQTSISGNVELNVDHPLALTTLKPIKSPWFSQIGRSLVYKGFGPQRYDFDLTYTYPVTFTMPPDFIQVLNADGVVYTGGTTFDTFTGTDGIRNIFTIEGSVSLNRGWSILFTNIPWLGKLSLVLTPQSGPTSSLAGRFA